MVLSAGIESHDHGDTLGWEIRAIGLVTGSPVPTQNCCLNSSRGCTEQVKCHQPPEESLGSAALFLKDPAPGKTARSLLSSHKDPVAKSQRGNCLTCRLLFGTCDCVRHYKQVGPAKLADTTVVSPGSFPFCLLSFFSLYANLLIYNKYTAFMWTIFKGEWHWQPMDCHDRPVDTSKPQPELWAMHSAPPATGGKWGMVCETCAGPGVLLLSRPVAIYALMCKVLLSHSACVGTAVGQALGLGPLGAWTGWFVAAGMGSSSEATGRLVLSLAHWWQWHPCPCFIQRPRTALSGRSDPTPSFASLCCLESGCTPSLWPVLAPFFPPPVSEIKMCTIAGPCPGILSPFHSHDAAVLMLQGAGYEDRQTG